jgi:hypothetical protein
MLGKMALALALIALSAPAGAENFSDDQSCSRFDASSSEECEGTIGGLQYRFKGTSGHIYTRPLAIDENSRLPLELEKTDAQSRTPSIRVECDRDKMTDAKSCDLFYRPIKGGPAGAFFIFAYGEGSSGRLCIGSNHYPGSQVRLRFDGGKMIVRSEREGDGCFPPATVRQMLAAERVVTQYMKWPYRTWVTSEGDTVGMKEAMKLADFLLKKL